MKLVRDVLDKQLVDRNGIHCGKVDGIVLTAFGSRPAEVAFIECGPTTLARRFGPWTARAVRWIAERIGPRRGVPHRIPWARVCAVAVDVGVDMTADDSALMAGEKWARDKVIAHIPGS